MSVFTNSASRSAEQARAYTSAVLDLLGTRDPLEVLESTVGQLHAVVAGLSRQAASQAESPGKWSVRQVLRHLADSELVWGYRLRLVLAHDRPALAGYDQDLWADRLGYDEAEMNDSLEVFAVLRRANLGLLKDASPEDLARVGVHAERGEESVAHMVRLYAGHDLLHIAQLERIRGAVTGESAG
ncbi:MAG: DinB family protein [Acidobacteriota bacterium]